MPPPPPSYTPPPPRAPKGGNTGLIIGLVAGAVALVVIVGAVLFVALGSDDKDKPAGPTASPTEQAASPTPTASGTPKLVDGASTAGGWPRDLDAERQLADEIAQQRRTFTERTQGKLDNVVTAFYKDPNGVPLGTRPAGVFFVGAEGGFGDPSVFVNSILKSSAGRGQEVDPGPAGGKGVCQTISRTNITLSWCAWATPRTIGMIFPTVPGQSADTLANQLRRMRPDLEKTQ